MIGTILISISAVILYVFAENIAIGFFNTEQNNETVILSFTETAKLWSYFLFLEVPLAVLVSVMYVLGDTRSKMILDFCIYWLFAFPALGIIVFWLSGDVYDVWLLSGFALVLMSVVGGLRCWFVLKRGLERLIA